MEISFIPTSAGDYEHSDDERNSKTSRLDSKKQKGIEKFGAGLEKGNVPTRDDMEPASRFGRMKRRSGVRSGSKNVFRKI